MLSGNQEVDKRYQVFVSSTYRDLVEERREVVQALLELDCIPVGMELFPATDDDAWTYIQDVIADCDYYLLIVGGRYGSTDENGISFTEREFDFAASQNVPIIAFLHGQPETLPAECVDMSPGAQKKLERFRRKVEKAKLCKYWSAPKELGGLVSRSYLQLIKRSPREGWVRGRFAASHEQLSELQNLREKVRSLEQAQDSRTSLATLDKATLVQGHDIIRFDFRFCTSHDPARPMESVYAEDFVELSFDAVFAHLAPSLLVPQSLSWIGTSLSSLVSRQLSNEQKPRFWQNPAQLTPSYQVYLNDGIRLTVALHFSALGFIRRIEPPDYVAKEAKPITDTYWTLTADGERRLTEMRVLRRPSAT